MCKIAFVIPWYGDDIRGGAESECNQLAHCLKEAGVDVEILATCVRESSDNRYTNTLPEGETVESGILVRRFKVKKGNIKEHQNANAKIYANEEFNEEDERMYLENDINSPDMYHFIEKNSDKYKWFIFIPYLYPISYFGSEKCPRNAVMIPCLHDEGYAYMKLMANRISKMKKLIFLSKPEAELAAGLYDLSNVETAVLGAYVKSGWEKEVNPEAFRRKYSIYDEFILCAGRKDIGKRTDELMHFFIHYKEKHPQNLVKLVYIGGGTLNIPELWQEEILDLGFVDIEDKYNAYAAATVLCNPSHFESFSIVIMESWLAKRPVLVSEHCKVTTNFAREACGGLYFGNYSDFEGCLEYMLSNKEMIDRMGLCGYEYVQNNFVNEVIQKKYLEFLEAKQQ